MPPPEMVSKRPRVDRFSNMFGPEPPHIPSGEELIHEFDRVALEVQRTQQLEEEIGHRIETLKAARTVNKLNQLRLIMEGKGIRDDLDRIKHELSVAEKVKQVAVIAACDEWEEFK